jgi:hypothetical protein
LIRDPRLERVHRSASICKVTGVAALPSEKEPVKSGSSNPSNLSVSVLCETLVELGRLRDQPAIQVSNGNFEKLIRQPELQQDLAKRGVYIGRHLDFLEEMG